MLGFKRFFNARRVVAGVELVQKIVKGQFDVPASFGTDPFCIWYKVQHAGGVNLAPICNRSPFAKQACRNRSTKNSEEHRIPAGYSQRNPDQIPIADLLSTDAMPNIVLLGSRRSVNRMPFWAVCNPPFLPFKVSSDFKLHQRAIQLIPKSNCRSC